MFYVNQRERENDLHIFMNADFIRMLSTEGIIFCINIFTAKSLVIICNNAVYNHNWGWLSSGDGAEPLSVPKSPTNLDNSRVSAYCACSRYGWCLFGIFSLPDITFIPPSPSLRKTARLRLNYCLK